MEGKKQLFRQYMMYSMEIHIPQLSKEENIHTKFPKCYLFMDKRHLPTHYKSKKMIKHFEENKDTLIMIYLPTAYHQNLW